MDSLLFSLLRKRSVSYTWPSLWEPQGVLLSGVSNIKGCISLELPFYFPFITSVNYVPIVYVLLPEHSEPNRWSFSIQETRCVFMHLVS